jgi:hypothetical protein
MLCWWDSLASVVQTIQDRQDTRQDKTNNTRQHDIEQDNTTQYNIVIIAQFSSPDLLLPVSTDDSNLLT